MNNGKLANYQSCKDKMRTGDLLQWRGHDYSMRAWRFLTRSKMNHSSMVLRLKEYEQLERKRFTTESRVHGTVLNRLSHRLEQYDGEVWWYPLKESWDPYRKEIGEQMLDRIGIPYDFSGVLKWSLRRLFGEKCRKVGNKVGLKSIVTWMNRHEQNEVFCSEYCFWVYEEATRNLPKQPQMKKLSELPLPDDMRKLEIFKEGQRIL